MSYKPFTKFKAAKEYFVRTINTNSNKGYKDTDTLDILTEYLLINEKNNLTAARFLIDNYNKVMGLSNTEVKVGS